MARLKTIDPSEARGRAKEIFNGPLKGKTFNIFKGMANSPAALDAYVALSGALADTSLSDAEREIVQLAVSQQNGCEYCQRAHTAIGKMAGLSDEQAVAARRGRLEDAKLDALARFALTIHEKKGWVSDSDLDAFRSAGYSDGHIAEVVATLALATYTNYFNHINQTEPDFPEVPEI